MKILSLIVMFGFGVLLAIIFLIATFAAFIALVYIVTGVLELFGKLAAPHPERS